MNALTLTGNEFNKAEMEYHGKFGHNLGRTQHIAIMSRIDIFMQPVVYKPKLWKVLFLVSKASSAVLNICLITLIKPHVTLIIIMMAQM